MVRDEISKSVVVDTYDSLEEWTATAYRNREKVHSDTDFALVTMDEACQMAKDGWAEGVAEATPITEQALQTIDRELDMPTFQAEYLMAGSEVDVGRFLQGVPECMIEYEERTVSKVGTVVTLCASLSASGIVSTSAFLKRGAAIVGLANALARCGHAVEIYASMDISAAPRDTKETATVRVLVKGAHDEIDESRIAYALAHPSMLRQLGFGVCHSLPGKFQQSCMIGSLYGFPTDPVKTLPEGTIYLPSILSDRDVPDADRFIADTLRELGLVD